MTKGLVRLRLLKVTRCQDAMMWYAKMVGEYVPYGGFQSEQWRSREPAGYVNFIEPEDARVVHVFVPAEKLGQYPYKYAQVEPQADYVTPPELVAKLQAEQKTCAQKCQMLGVCHSLPDCQESMAMQRIAERKAHANQAKQTLGQSHRASAVEAATNIVLGFAVSVGITAVLLPYFGHQVTLAQNVAMTSVFTVASFARAYGLRRLFNWLQVRGHGAKP